MFRRLLGCTTRQRARFFETGVKPQRGRSEQQWHDFRLSYTWLDQTGTVPNADLNRNTAQTLAGGYNLSPKLKVRTAINYMKNTKELPNAPT